jgi:protein tyrosine phosphatase (PTP) superfamily phosphohydrolase (DUF442 family)
MAFALPDDLVFNRGAVADPAALAEEADAASWLYLCGDAWAEMDGGMAFDQVQAAVPESQQIVTDPPVELDLDLVREHLDALDRLPRPTLITCRTGPRSSAIAYLYAGLQAGASAEEVLAAAAADAAPFTQMEPLRRFVAQGLDELA